MFAMFHVLLLDTKVTSGSQGKIAQSPKKPICIHIKVYSPIKPLPPATVSGRQTEIMEAHLDVWMQCVNLDQNGNLRVGHAYGLWI